MAVSRPNDGGLTSREIEKILNLATPNGAIQREILVEPNTVGDPITDEFTITRAFTPSQITLITSEALITPGTYTLDVEVNGISILSGLFDLTSLVAKTLTVLLASVPELARGDDVVITTTSDDVTLTGSGLRIIFEAA